VPHFSRFSRSGPRQCRHHLVIGSRQLAIESSTSERETVELGCCRTSEEEDKRPMIDDVIYLKGEEVSNEYRLSKILTEGCEGSRWVGYGKQGTMRI
jgi:hypothetical protein